MTATLPAGVADPASHSDRSARPTPPATGREGRGDQDGRVADGHEAGSLHVGHEADEDPREQYR